MKDHFPEVFLQEENLTDVKSIVWHVCSTRDIPVIGRVHSHVSIVPDSHVLTGW